MSRKKKIISIAIFTCVVLGGLIFILLFRNKTGSVSPKDRSNVVIITLDTTRADRIGAYGYKEAETPHIDSLANQGVLFTNAISAVPLTLPSHCSIFTGRSVLSHQVRNNGTYFLPTEVDTLAEILKGYHYRTAAFVSSFTLDSRFGLHQGFDEYNDDLVLNQTQVKTFDSERPAEMVYNDFSVWLKNNNNNKFFAWVHFYDPHMPYTPPEPFASQFRDNPYDGEIAYMDGYVGKVIGLLREQGVLQNTLVIIAGDHGEAFGEHRELGHGIFCYQETLKVPLIMSGPGLGDQPQVINQQVDLTDILPTLLECLAIKQPKKVEGRSLMPPITQNQMGKRVFYFESVMPNEALGCAVVKGIIKDNFKLIELPTPELYDLAKDPQETQNIFYKQNDVSRDLQQELTTWTAKYKSNKVASKRQLSGEEVKKLRSLGYLSSTAKSKDPEKLPDPKDKVDGWNEFVKGNISFSQGKIEEAVAHFNQSIQLNRDFSEPYALLAYISYKKGNISEAKSYYEKGMAVNSDDYILHLEYIKLLISQNELMKALKKLRELEQLKLVAFEVEVFHLSGVISMKSNNNTEAIYYFEKALQIEPENFAISMMLAKCLNRMQRYSEALTVFLPLEKQSPKDFELLLGIAMTHGDLEQYRKSFKYFEKVMAINPLPAVKFYYAIFLSRSGQVYQAIKYMKEFVTAHPQEDAMRRDALQCLQIWQEQNK